MCNVKVKDRVPSKELRERVGIDDIILILQQNRLRWYGHVLRKEDTVGACPSLPFASFPLLLPLPFSHFYACFLLQNDPFKYSVI